MSTLKEHIDDFNPDSEKKEWRIYVKIDETEEQIVMDDLVGRKADENLVEEVSNRIKAYLKTKGIDAESISPINVPCSVIDDKLDEPSSNNVTFNVEFCYSESKLNNLFTD